MMGQGGATENVAKIIGEGIRLKELQNVDCDVI
jgi:hypothetical protein